jgi:Fe-S-cluster containining protein
MRSFDAGGGVCKHLTADNLCAIYDRRPVICNGEMIYQKYVSGISRKDFFLLNLRRCMELSEEFGDKALDKQLKEAYDFLQQTEEPG